MPVSTGTTDADAIDVVETIDDASVGRLQIWIGVCCALILFVDGFDTQTTGFIMPQIAKAWSIPHDLLGPIFSAGLIGLFVGYLAISPLSARFGHKRTMVGCATAFGLVTLLTTFARDPYALIAFRFVTGIGLGGAFPSALALAGEYCPARRRSTAITLVISGLSLGSTCAGLAAALLLEPFGWQGVLIVGGVLPLAAAILLALTVPESMAVLVARRPAEARAVLSEIAPSAIMAHGADAPLLLRTDRAGGAATELFRNRRTLGTLVLWLAVAFNLVVNYAMQNWLTTILVGLGQSQSTAIGATTLLNAGGILSGFIIGPLMDRFGRYRVMSALFCACAIFVFLIGATLTAPALALLASTFWAGFCSNGLQKSAGALSVFFYPPALRSTGVGWTFGVGRVGAILGPLAVGALLTAGWTPTRMLDVACIPMLLGAAAIALMGWRYHGGAAAASPMSIATVPVQPRRAEPGSLRDVR